MIRVRPFTLRSKLNLSPEQVMAVGDQENDQAMLEVAGLPVAMDNASPELKRLRKKDAIQR
ncbi:MAG: HAD hydrolase family protein [Streptococcus sp.]